MKLKRGRLHAPIRVMIYGKPKTGKTTAASDAPSPIFISGEAGDGQFDVGRYIFDEKTDRHWPVSYAEVIAAVRDIARSPEGKTLVFDGFTKIEQLCAEHVCRENKWTKGLGEPGFNRGEKALFTEMKTLLGEIEKAWAGGKSVIFVCHDKVGKVKNPAGDEYQQFQPALVSANDADVMGYYVGWCDAVLFAQVEVAVEVREKERRAIGIGTGRHVFRTRPNPGWVAGNRYNLGEVIDLDFKSVLDSIDESQSPDRMRAKVVHLLASKDEATQKKYTTWLASPAAKDVSLLQRAVETLSAVEQAAA